MLTLIRIFGVRADPSRLPVVVTMFTTQKNYYTLMDYWDLYPGLQSCIGTVVSLKFMSPLLGHHYPKGKFPPSVDGSPIPAKYQIISISGGTLISTWPIARQCVTLK